MAMMRASVRGVLILAVTMMLGIGLLAAVARADVRENVRAIGSTYGICVAMVEAFPNGPIRQQCEDTALMALRSLGVCVRGNRLPPTAASMEKTPPEMYVCGGSP